jgi:PAS domain S-box-containing protein
LETTTADFDKLLANGDISESEAFLQAVIEYNISGLLIFQENRIVFSNPRTQELLGLNEEEIKNTDPFLLVHPEDRPVLKERAARRLAGEAAPAEYEFRIVNRQGQTRWLRLLARLVQYRSKPASLATIIDVTERRAAEEEVQEKERLNRIILDSLPHPAMLISKDKVILAANRSASEMGARVGGYCWEEFAGETFTSKVDSPDHGSGPNASRIEKIACRFCRAEEAMKSRRALKEPELRAFGRVFEAWWVPVGDTAYLHFMIDVTERKHAETRVTESEQRYRLLTESMTEGLLVMDRDGSIRSFNRKWKQIWGSETDDLVGRPIGDLFSGPKKSLVEALIASQMENPDPFEAYIETAGRKKTLCSVTITPLLTPEGDHVGSFALFTDMTGLRGEEENAVHELEGIIGHDPLMLKLFDQIREVAPYNFPVVLMGESGTGKELVAKAIHRLSGRANKLFVPVSCGALAEPLLESELFGHVKGAFTGALRERKGRFALADGGTIFLDEIGELSPSTQVKLLRVLQESTFERVGDNRIIEVDMRVIAATNKDLKKEVSARRFREDLYYRLSVVPIYLPPLRDRIGDVPLLADYFLKITSKETGRPQPSLSVDALRAFINHHWPGNVRELRNAVEYAFVKCVGGKIEPKHLPASVLKISKKEGTRKPRSKKLDEEAVRKCLENAKGNRAKAARLLGVSRATLYRYLSQAQEPGSGE